MSYTVTGTATRAKFHDARRHFEAGGEVVVSEHGEQLAFDVTTMTTTHTKESTTWDDLVEQVRMWSGRHPNQRYYIVTRPEPADDEPTIAEDLDEKVRAVLDVLSEAGTDVATAFTCTEAETVADLYRAMGDDDGAQAWLDNHATDDEMGDAHYQGDDLDPDKCAAVMGHRRQYQCGAEQDAGSRYCLTHQHLAADDDLPEGQPTDDPGFLAGALRGRADLIREGDAVTVWVAVDNTGTGNGYRSGRMVGAPSPIDYMGSPALMLTLDPGHETGRYDVHTVMESAVTYWLDLHDARPDDQPEPGDRCKDCGRQIMWDGPSQHDWHHADGYPGSADVEAAGLDATLRNGQGSGPGGIYTWLDLVNAKAAA